MFVWHFGATQPIDQTKTHIIHIFVFYLVLSVCHIHLQIKNKNTKHCSTTKIMHAVLALSCASSTKMLSLCPFIYPSVFVFLPFCLLNDLAHFVLASSGYRHMWGFLLMRWIRYESMIWVDHGWRKYSQNTCVIVALVIFVGAGQNYLPFYLSYDCQSTSE